MNPNIAAPIAPTLLPQQLLSPAMKTRTRKNKFEWLGFLIGSNNEVLSMFLDEHSTGPTIFGHLIDSPLLLYSH